MTTAQALDELKRFAGTQFDPDLVSVILNAGTELDAARLEMERKPKGDYFVTTPKM
jgi:HD-GYP domain-containing protein (c-di-GMP phosphodiesterase class II)